MKIAFVIEYFRPMGAGGSGWSTYYLAKDLAANNQEVVVLTPNYGAKKTEFDDGIRILRFPFYLKLKNFNQLPGNFALTNPFWILWTVINLFLLIRKENPDVIHVQGKYSVPPAVIANLFFKKPLVATIRDYQLICNYGFCLYRGNKACNIFEYFSHDFTYYLKNYLKFPNPLVIFLNVLYALWGRIARNLMKIFGMNVNIVVLSQKQKEIFLANGFKKVTVIGNSFSFAKVLPKIKKQNALLFAGRLTLGKGVGLLIKTLPKLMKSFPNYKFYFVGDGPLINDLTRLKRANKNIYIQILGQINHGSLLKLMSKVKLVLVPSLWPEPFGRVALEAISQGTPVVASNKGGLPEIIKDGRYGLIINPTKENLIKGVKRGLKENKKLQNNIYNDFAIIKRKFQKDISKAYIKLYKNLIK